MKPTSDILERIFKNSSDHKDGIQTRLFRYLLREDIYYSAYQKLYSNKGAATKGIDNDTADGFGKKYVDSLISDLQDLTYRPKPVRREYIKKKNGKLRPLGIPSFRDKLLQEVIRRFLEAIYEPSFNDFSHGFRPQKSCHTALKLTRCYFGGARWFIEGDIRGCFDNIDHDKLIEILGRRIKDSRFLNIIRQFLKAGYMEDWQYNNTYSGAAQGGIISPILANIYLNELDKKVMEIKETFDAPAKKAVNPSYLKVKSRIYYLNKKLKIATEAEKATLLSEISNLRKQGRKLPYKSQTDKNIAYVRYADDWLVGIRGSKEDCESIKNEMSKFLKTELKLELSEEKTLITHSSNKVRFLGYDISVRRSQQFKPNKLGIKRRTLNGTVELLVPLEKVEEFMFDKDIIRQVESGKYRSMHRKGWLYMPDYEIVERYNAEIRGILNYYHLAVNFSKLNYFQYLMEYSCLATLAGKYNSTISKVIDKYNQRGGGWGIKYSIKEGTKIKRIVKLGDCKSYNGDAITRHIYSAKSNGTIRARLQSGLCELCGSRGQTGYEVHHVSNLKGLSGNAHWEQVMQLMRRKTLVVCEDCHRSIHE